MHWNLHSAALEFETTEPTIKKGLIANGHEVKRGEKFSTRDIHLALTGDLKTQRTRREAAEADKAEIEAAIAKKEVIPISEVMRYIQQTFQPVREQALAMPGALSALCNPTDPQHAREHLQIWSDGFLKHCREHKPAPVLPDVVVMRSEDGEDNPYLNKK